MEMSCKHKELRGVFNFYSKNVLPLMGKKNKYSKIVKLCKASKKLGVTSYEIDTIDDKANSVLIRTDSFKGLLITKNKCVTFCL